MNQFRRTTLIGTFCMAVLIGLVAPLWFEIPQYFAMIAGLASLALLRLNKPVVLVSIILLGLCLGFWRGVNFLSQRAQLYRLVGNNFSFYVVATSDAVYARQSQLEFTANNIVVGGRTYVGSLRISGFGEPMIYRGDRLLVDGKMYPASGANQGRVSYAQIKRIDMDGSLINQLTRRFSTGMQNALPEPSASFGLGLLIGQRSGLPDTIIKQMTAVGLLHIVAVSGYNLTILVRAVSKPRFGSKFQKLVLSLGLIGSFLLVTGFSASIVRAALISGIGLWAWFYGLKLKPFLALSLTAALTAFVKPFYIWGDPGWYLSFLAFFGVLIIAPIVCRRFLRRQPRMLVAVMVETIAAELMTLPLIMLVFGQLSLIGLLSNVLVVPLVPLAMLLSALAGISGMLIAPLCGWFAWPAQQLLSYLLDLVNFFSGLPGIILHRSISPLTMIAAYTGILISVAVAHQAKRIKLEV